MDNTYTPPQQTPLNIDMHANPYSIYTQTRNPTDPPQAVVAENGKRIPSARAYFPIKTNSGFVV